MRVYLPNRLGIPSIPSESAPGPAPACCGVAAGVGGDDGAWDILRKP